MCLRIFLRRFLITLPMNTSLTVVKNIPLPRHGVSVKPYLWTRLFLFHQIVVWDHSSARMNKGHLPGNGTNRRFFSILVTEDILVKCFAFFLLTDKKHQMRLFRYSAFLYGTIRSNVVNPLRKHTRKASEIILTFSVKLIMKQSEDSSHG